MLEILIIILVVRAFVRVAKEKKLSPGLWGFIGAASYYIPILLLSFVIFPYLVEAGFYSPKSEAEVYIVVILSNIIVGILCCFIAYRILKGQPSRAKMADDNVIDTFN